MIFQTQEPDPSFEHVGCAFDTVASWRELPLTDSFVPKPWGLQELGKAWADCKDNGILDDGYNITDWQKLVDFFGLPLKFLGHAPLGELAPGHIAACAWHNDRTGFTHFVDGQKKPVRWDPIEGGSVTVREGYTMPLNADTGEGGLRLFEIVI